jgi:hypothetical protein
MISSSTPPPSSRGTRDPCAKHYRPQVDQGQRHRRLRRQALSLRCSQGFLLRRNDGMGRRMAAGYIGVVGPLRVTACYGLRVDNGHPVVGRALSGPPGLARKAPEHLSIHAIPAGHSGPALRDRRQDPPRPAWIPSEVGRMRTNRCSPNTRTDPPRGIGSFKSRYWAGFPAITAPVDREWS